MSITKKIRGELATSIMIKAISKHAPGFTSEAMKLATRFQDAHSAHLLRILPEVQPKRYGELLINGLLHGTTSGVETVFHAAKEGHSAYGKNLGQADLDNLNSDLVKAIQAQLSQDADWSRLFGLVYFHNYSAWLPTRLSMRIRYSQTMPDFQGRDCIKLGKAPEGPCKAYVEDVIPLVNAADKLIKELAKVILEGLKYREEVLDILTACRTRKQMEDLFPEAAALLPPVVSTRKDIVPTELAKKVRQRLIDGVPV